MDSNEDNSLANSILAAQKREEEREREKERKKKAAEYQRKRNSRSDVKEKESYRRTNKKMIKEFSELGKVDPHKICKKLGSKSMKSVSKDGIRTFKCRTCNVTYSEKQKKFFWKNNGCPCCHYKLSIRKTVSEKKKYPNKIKRIS